MAALLAYALAPAVKVLERVMPRFLAILIVYLIVLGALSALLYLIVSTAIVQFASLSDYVRFLLTPGTVPLPLMPCTTKGHPAVAALTNAMRLVTTEQEVDPEAAQKRRVIFVLLSDGDDTAGEIEKPLADLIRSVIKVYAIGLGTANGSYVPLEMAGGLNGQVVKYLQRDGGSRLVSHAEARTMRQISERTGGGFFRGESDKQVDQAIEEILFAARPVSGFQSNAVRKDLYIYFLMAAFACLLAGAFL